MRISVISLKSHRHLARKIKDILAKEAQVEVYAPGRRLIKLVGEIFKRTDFLIMIAPLGVVVRSISPYLVDKISDPSVIAVDPIGKFVISVLCEYKSQEMVDKLSNQLGFTPVCTSLASHAGVKSPEYLAWRMKCFLMNEEDLPKVQPSRENIIESKAAILVLPTPPFPDIKIFT